MILLVSASDPKQSLDVLIVNECNSKKAPYFFVITPANNINDSHFTGLITVQSVATGNTHPEFNLIQ